MSFPYSQDARRRRVGAGAGFSATGRRTFMGYWVPLALTVGVATIGVAAWIWSERSEDDDDDENNHHHHHNRDYPRDDERFPAPGPAGGPGLPRDAYEEGDYARTTGTDVHGEHPDDASVMARMQGALRRTPSPQQIFDGASKRVAAGVAAAGAFVGGALTSIREEDRGDFEDHSRWSEEVENRASRGRGQQQQQPQQQQPDVTAPTMSGALPGQAGVDKRKKTVAIVVSSDASHLDPEEFSSEHVSILSHLPEHVNPDTTRIFVMIYAPGLKHAPSQGNGSHPTLSVTSSYSNIAPEEAQSLGELPSPGTVTAADEPEGSTPLFKTMYTQAQAIVEKTNTIMPFSTRTGYVHLVRHISPDIVYVQESLAGKDGEAVHHISGWVRQVVVVVGDEGGRGGLVDSEDESALGEPNEPWWQKEGTTGIGKRIDVVDALRTGDDWRRRVSGFD
ncbi:uncharacterized protein LDX57_011160 [Aspergillus melleus]|uniref:uncharacterized protein n=1 Tax=Aspergillus melleus TaxID=138277 RepID=UPI001E8CA425|nr:uncharacterized protein LDX57_011160 [Aspergillus melleus]KAH8433526.1 hypothetical protein LDX57_011160 [Aspergillus melleus]